MKRVVFFSIIFVLAFFQSSQAGCWEDGISFKEKPEIFSGIAEKDGYDVPLRINEVYATSSGMLKAGDSVEVYADGFEGFDTADRADFVKGKEFIVYGTKMKGRDAIFSNGSNVRISTDSILEEIKAIANLKDLVVGQHMFRFYFIGTLSSARKKETYGYEADFKVDEMLLNPAHPPQKEMPAAITASLECSVVNPQRLIGNQYLVVMTVGNWGGKPNYSAAIWDLDEKAILRKRASDKQ